MLGGICRATKDLGNAVIIFSWFSGKANVPKTYMLLWRRMTTVDTTLVWMKKLLTISVLVVISSLMLIAKWSWTLDGLHIAHPSHCFLGHGT